MDITDSTVTTDNLANGVVAYNAAGERIVGTMQSGALSATVSYTGDGTYKAANFSSITFDFVPKLVMISPAAGYSGSTAQYAALFNVAALSNEFKNAGYWVQGSTSYGKTKCFAKIDGTTLSWYGTDSAVNQLNVDGATYFVVAIG